jgi:16S rRNA (cytosine1402-N4)-methyltransferase
MSSASQHETVLQVEAVNALEVKAEGKYIDATFGRGGHSKAILSSLNSEGELIALDRDPAAITAAGELQKQDSRLQVAHAAFSQLGDLEVTKNLAGKVDGILFDLGVSSPQLDDPLRGFSFMHSGPLDMRMNPTDKLNAEEWINCASEKEIADVIFQFGEERYSRRMAKRIVIERQEARISTTGQLAEIVKEANPAWEKDKHPATRAFQAIRIHINDELGEIVQGLDSALDLLRDGGRLVVISFHSLEDRIVKKFIAEKAKGDNFPRDLPITTAFLNPTLKKIGKPIKATEQEIANNPRARSAVMRVAEKLN